MNDSRLREALQALVTKLDKVTEDTKGLFAMAWAHGQMYQGANYGEELKAAKAALAEPASDLRAKLEALRRSIRSNYECNHKDGHTEAADAQEAIYYELTAILEGKE